VGGNCSAKLFLSHEENKVATVAMQERALGIAEQAVGLAKIAMVGGAVTSVPVGAEGITFTEFMKRAGFSISDKDAVIFLGLNGQAFKPDTIVQPGEFVSAAVTSANG
jgi:hypothetical protein